MYFIFILPVISRSDVSGKSQISFHAQTAGQCMCRNSIDYFWEPLDLLWCQAMTAWFKD